MRNIGIILLRMPVSMEVSERLSILLLSCMTTFMKSKVTLLFAMPHLTLHIVFRKRIQQCHHQYLLLLHIKVTFVMPLTDRHVLSPTYPLSGLSFTFHHTRRFTHLVRPWIHSSVGGSQREWL